MVVPAVGIGQQLNQIAADILIYQIAKEGTVTLHKNLMLSPT